MTLSPDPNDDEDGFVADFCVDCGDTFNYDDCGGYNPPCGCGIHCRSCHDRETHRDSDDDDTEDYDDDPR